LDGNVVGVDLNTTEVATDVQDTRSPQNVSPSLGLTVLSAYPLDGRRQPASQTKKHTANLGQHVAVVIAIADWSIDVVADA
jgi:hypothetical protein